MKGAVDSWIASLAVAIMAAACSSTPPPETVDPKPEPTTKPKPPPPPPKCESLDEGCKAKSKTMASLPGGFQFHPPKGWAYAQLEAGTLAQVDGKGGAALVLTTMDAKSAKQSKAREEKLLELVELVGVTPPSSKFGDIDTVEVGNLEKLKMQERRTKASRGDAKGPLVVLLADLDDTTALFGFAFVPDADDKSPEAVVESVGTVEKAEGGSSDESSKKDAP